MMSLLLALSFIILQSPLDVYKAGVSDMDAGRWAEASARFEQVLKDDPTHIPSEFSLAVCYTKLGKTDEAQALYRKILDQDGEVYEARINLAILLDHQNNTVAADEQFEKAAAIRPQDPRPVLYRAHLLEKRGDSIGAAEQYEHAIELNPSDPEARVAAGMFYLKIGKAENAYGHLTAAEQAGARSPQLYIALSEAEHLRKNEAQSTVYLEKALELDGKNPALRRQLALLYRQAGQLDKSIAVLKPGMPDTQLDLAVAYFDNRDFSEAAPLLEQLAAGSPLNADYSFMLGKAQMELKLFSKSAATMQHVLNVDPKYLDAYFFLGWDFYELEDWTRAIAAMERYIPSKPRQAFPYFVLAICNDKLGNVKEALLNYNKFSQLDDGSNDARSFQARERAKTLERRLKNNPG